MFARADPGGTYCSILVLGEHRRRDSKGGPLGDLLGVILLREPASYGRVSLKPGDREGSIQMQFTALVSTSFKGAFGFLAGLLLYVSMKRGILEY